MQPPRSTTYCEFHLGDNFAALHLLRYLALNNQRREFVHYAHGCHLSALGEMVQDIPNLKLCSLDDCHSPAASGAVNLWKNADGFWQNHSLKNDWLAFQLDCNRMLAGKLGFDLTSFIDPEELRLNYPALRNPRSFHPEVSRHWDFLIVNSRPQSGQLMAYDSVDYLDPLIDALVKKGASVIVTQPSKLGVPCTQDYHLSITAIGYLATMCRHHIMVSTGPSWAVMNKWTAPNYTQFPGRRILMLERERVNFLGVEHAENIGQVFEIAQRERWV